MTLIPLGTFKTPTYLAVNADIVDSKIAGAEIVGGTVFLTDTGEWKIIIDDLTLVDYYSPPAYSP